MDSRPNLKSLGHVSKDAPKRHEIIRNVTKLFVLDRVISWIVAL